MHENGHSVSSSMTYNVNHHKWLNRSVRMTTTVFRKPLKAQLGCHRPVTRSPGKLAIWAPSAELHQFSSGAVYKHSSHEFAPLVSFLPGRSSYSLVESIALPPIKNLYSKHAKRRSTLPTTLCTTGNGPSGRRQSQCEEYACRF